MTNDNNTITVTFTDSINYSAPTAYVLQPGSTIGQALTAAGVSLPTGAQLNVRTANGSYATAALSTVLNDGDKFSMVPGAQKGA